MVSPLRAGRVLIAALAITAPMLAGSADAKDLGIIGPVYPITEPDLLEMMLGTLRDAETSGLLTRLKRESQERIIRGIEDPPSVRAVTRATQARTTYYDPSVVITQPVTDAEGRVLVAGGTRVNPLDTVTLSKPLVFFDARDVTQVKRVSHLLEAHRGRLKLILTGGSYLELMRRWQLPVYFDQQGALVEQLGIRQVPALVTQEGRRLRIDEML